MSVLGVSSGPKHLVFSTSIRKIQLLTPYVPLKSVIKVNVLKFQTKCLRKMAYANSEDLKEQSDQGLHVLPFH